MASAAWRQDGSQLATGDKSHTIRLWKGDFSPDGLIETPADGVLGLAYVPGQPLLVSAGSDGLARLWQLPVVEPKRLDAKGPLCVFAVSHDGQSRRDCRAGQECADLGPADGKPSRRLAAMAIRWSPWP